MAYQFLQFAELAWESHDPELIYTADICANAPFHALCALVIGTFLAQTVLTARIYAVTKKNVPIASGFALITVAQFGLGVSAAYLASPFGPADSPTGYEACSFGGIRLPSPGETAYASLSLIYDTLAFLAVILQARRLRVWGFSTSTLLDTIAEDSTRYFAVIFTNHLVLVMTLSQLGESFIRFLPIPGANVFLPLMISRILLSLKKAADSSRTNWSLTQDTTFRDVIVFRPPLRSGSIGGEDTSIPLDTFRET